MEPTQLLWFSLFCVVAYAIAVDENVAEFVNLFIQAVQDRQYVLAHACGIPAIGNPRKLMHFFERALLAKSLTLLLLDVVFYQSQVLSYHGEFPMLS